MKNQTHQKDLIYKLALTQIPMVGPVIAKSLLAYCGSVEAIFKEKLSALKEIPSVGDRTAREVFNFQDFGRCEEELLYMERYNIQGIFFTDSDYPIRLKHIHQAPLMLFVKGNADLNPDRTVAIVGTRKCTAYARDFCRELVRDLKSFSTEIISGLALGIDSIAHEEALKQDIPTHAVLAHGLDRTYPSSNIKLAQKILDQGGCLISEYMSKTIPDREHFPMRNRIVAGMVDAVIVIESPIKGGSMITADLGFQYNREIFALPNRVGQITSTGCHLLIKSQRAHLLEYARDVARVLNWDLENRPKPAQLQMAIDLPPDEDRIFQFLKDQGPSSIDKLAYELNTSTSKLSITLLQLEFKNIVRNLPGKIYEVC
jgi:DNA processing protein